MPQRQGLDAGADRLRSSDAQQHLSTYLQAELHHSLGAYRVTATELRSVAEQLAAVSDKTDFETGLGQLAERAARYNELLAQERHAAQGGRRHPIPQPAHRVLTKLERFKRPPAGEPWDPPKDTWPTILHFYDVTIMALEGKSIHRSVSSSARTFAKNLTMRRDGQSLTWPDAQQTQQREHRLARYRQRRAIASRALPNHPEDEELLRPENARDLLKSIRSGNLDENHSLPLLALRALAEAHISMHAVEAWRALPLGEHAQRAAPRDVQRWLHEELDRCIALDTFAYCVGRSAPWLFAEDEDEAVRVFEDLPRAWHNVVPTRCMWIAEQVCLLALHRRAYARSLKRDLPVRRTEAYNDYHKLQRLIRDATRRVESAPLHVESALEFLEALDAQAHHHIGELYRAEHAQKPASKHFRTASHRLDQLKERARRDKHEHTDGRIDMSDVLTDSRWHVELQLSHGKAHYEMGHHKESLCWHLRGWRAFLHLLAAETSTEAETQELDDAIEWLTVVRFEPELRKSELQARVEPIVAQLDRIAVVRRLGALAADVLLRLGHLLFVLNLGLNDEPPPTAPLPATTSDRVRAAAEAAKSSEARRRIARTLGFRCLRKAAECDPHNTLVGADLLKARYRLRSWFRGDLPPAYADALRSDEVERLESVEAHWPGGGDDYEQIVRVAEYLMLKAHPYATSSGGSGNGTAAEHERTVANELLLNFFMNTDSINVRKSQVHRYLMQPRACQQPELDGPAIEFVCMRRYSSAFPLLPRPSAFRALGGGYFVRLHGSATARHDPFGIVVDPGPDFVENLYRTGFALDDVDMIVVTHDHVDHLGSLDSLLSLLYTHAEVHRHERRDADDGRGINKMGITLLMNESVTARYRDATRLHPKERCVDLADFLFDPRDAVTPTQNLARLAGFPQEEFELLSMSTDDVDGDGHLDLSEKPSYGLCFRVRPAVGGKTGGGRASVAIAGDTPKPRKTEWTRWTDRWRPALEADVLVVHLSTVPLTELRQLTGLDATTNRPAREDLWDIGLSGLQREARQVDLIRSRLERPDVNLRGQLEFALWLRSQGETSGDEPATLLGRVPPDAWEPWQGHSYLSGTLDWAREYRRSRRAAGRRQGLFVIGELSEELGTMRGKVAKRLNDTVLAPEPGSDERAERFYALTSDIGLQACVGPEPADRRERRRATVTRVCCTTCNLDMDRVRGEQLHRPQEIDEVCVKGENEGIFYNCEEHTSYLSEQPIFLEQLERFDVFGR